MLSMYRKNILKSLARSRSIPVTQPRRFQTVWSHSTNEKVKTSADVNTDKKPFNEEVSQEKLDEMKKHSDSFEQSSKKETTEYTKKYSEGFKNLKDKGKRTAEEQARAEDYIIAAKIIPKLPDYTKFSEAKNCKEADYYTLYTDLVSKLLHDKHIKNIKNHLNSSCALNTENDVCVEHSEIDEVNGEIIEPQTLKVFLEKHRSSILLVDVRPREDFKKNHILTENIICLEPISIRSQYFDHDIENLSLLNSPDHEKALFKHRDNFDLVIIYDETSQFPHDSKSSENLMKILCQKSFEKPLKRKPMFLKGGIQGWMNVFGLSSFGHNHGFLTHPGKHRPRTSSRSSSFSNQPIARNFHDYLSNPIKNDFHSSTPQFYVQRPTSPNIKRSSSFKLPSLRPVSSPGNIFNNKSPKSGNTVSPKSLNGITDSKQNANQKIEPTLPSVSKILNTNDLHCTTGLYNIGNTCYMNSIIQCLLGTPPFLQFFLNGSYKEHVNINSKLGTKGIMAKFFAELAQAVFKQNGRVYEPKNFKIAIGSLNTSFKNNDQQDCSEFLNFVLDGLHEDLNEEGNRPRLGDLTTEEEELRERMPIRLASVIEWERYLKTNYSAVVALFQGQYLSQLKCLECGTTSTTYQAFSVLSLPIPQELVQSPLEKISLKRCLEEFTKLEVLDGDDRWNCSKCKQLRKSTKKITITRLPSNLVIHLKRFKTGVNLQKITTFIEYPFEMDLTDYWPKVVSKEESKKLLTFPLRGQTPPFKYNLYGVSNHSGTLVGGHYTSYVWKGTNKKWCYFDDTRIVQNFTKTNVINSNAYVLFYTRVN
ncbi:Ubiquitin carboxyl-terminal hydrolase [Wickerhamomyces ciferrii]|uniref:Ubiquitin carboxyl-terminal hydrolase n=1 Tax=Wickerhamomyces ciferrii (strain ATCC 14091 / BCRC 22168 / CBS 111 / JCM 3599 / NBRC 0793 / NRRL Y-1031 F-60-10) TaxID=1206466 RepID=K0KIT9_WICCF|nr:Ubiquitin carboxyl-terminal hydrolase [Wickerhamomyces ciferrii]CCH45135.1 Ubiquitin carboxyl-terminal hydrolase [Wickerhamomyces ciferrii]